MVHLSSKELDLERAAPWLKKYISFIEKEAGYSISESTYWFFALDEFNEIAAVSGLTIFREGFLGYFGPTFVHEIDRGKGYQFKLIKEKLKFAKANNIRFIISVTDKNNIPSNKNLQKSHFRIIENNSKNPFDNSMETIYWKSLKI